MPPATGRIISSSCVALLAFLSFLLSESTRVYRFANSVGRRRHHLAVIDIRGDTAPRELS